MKKKLIALVLAVVCMASLAVPALADGTTTLTTTVPSATYTMTIPADTTVDFGTTSKDIGKVTVAAVDGFNTGKNVKVTVTHTDFTSQGVSTTIPFTITAASSVIYGSAGNTKTYYPIQGEAGGTLLFSGCGTNGLYVMTGEGGKTIAYGNSNQYYSITIRMNSTDWGKALAGDYTGSIEFTSEIVAAES